MSVFEQFDQRMERNRCVILGRNQEEEPSFWWGAIKREPEIYVSEAINMMGLFGVEGHIRVQETFEQLLFD